ncbi:hypothetical protein [Burkholderia anthina]|uniref:hypothetical protein n=1 Tax=Burkholderia anthina TaxID=179879 RepID=UPI00158D2408|nr:hypothetical protein [Burkholderia anthina]
MEKITMCCPSCGSDDVTKDAIVSWDRDLQRWENAGVLDSGNCNHCGREVKYLDDVPLQEEYDAKAASA